MSFIRCPTCSFVLGKYLQFIRLASHAQYLDKIDGTASVDPDARDNDGNVPTGNPANVSFRPDRTPPLGNVLNLLEVRNVCCRTHVTTSTRIE